MGCEWTQRLLGLAGLRGTDRECLGGTRSCPLPQCCSRGSETLSTYARVCRPCPHTPVVPPGLPPGSACSRSSSLETSGCLQALRLYVLWVMGQLGSLPPHPPDRRCEDWETSRGVSSGTTRSRRWRTSTPCHPRALPYSFSKHTEGQRVAQPGARPGFCHQGLQVYLHIILSSCFGMSFQSSVNPEGGYIFSNKNMLVFSIS